MAQPRTRSLRESANRTTGATKGRLKNGFDRIETLFFRRPLNNKNRMRGCAAHPARLTLFRRPPSANPAVPLQCRLYPPAAQPMTRQAFILSDRTSPAGGKPFALLTANPTREHHYTAQTEQRQYAHNPQVAPQNQNVYRLDKTLFAAPAPTKARGERRVILSARSLNGSLRRQAWCGPSTRLLAPRCRCLLACGWRGCSGRSSRLGAR